MSSRVRLMLQDWGNGTCKTGKAAYQHLQELYNVWEKSVQKGRTVTKMVWRHTTAEYAGAHPFTCSRFHVPPEAIDIKWDGPGFYQKTYDAVTEGAKPVPALPAGPKWQVAQEMWSRMQDTHAGNFRLFLSRDNRKHAWRKSLCNPYYQQFGWKPRKAVAKKVKKVPDRAAGTRGYWDDPEHHRFEIPAPRSTRVVQTPETKQAPVKPRVGIWS